MRRFSLGPVLYNCQHALHTGHHHQSHSIIINASVYFLFSPVPPPPSAGRLNQNSHEGVGGGRRWGGGVSWGLPR